MRAAIIKDILNFPLGELRSIIIKVQHNCVSDRKFYGKLENPPIKHEYCVIFKKPHGKGINGYLKQSESQTEIEEAIRAAKAGNV